MLKDIENLVRRYVKEQLETDGTDLVTTVRDVAEWAAIDQVLIHCRGNQTQAAAITGLSRSGTYVKIKKGRPDAIR